MYCTCSTREKLQKVSPVEQTSVITGVSATKRRARHAGETKNQSV